MPFLCVDLTVGWHSWRRARSDILTETIWERKCLDPPPFPLPSFVLSPQAPGRNPSLLRKRLSNPNINVRADLPAHHSG